MESLRARDRLLRATRSFFQDRGIVEVETPLLCREVAVEDHIDPISVRSDVNRENSEERFLVTSPELAMKRLLAAGSGPIFQLAHAFRKDEVGRLHNPEFTLLEWYRPGYSLEELMSEVGDLVREVGSVGAGISSGPFHQLTYQEAFLRWLHIDPLTSTVSELSSLGREKDLSVPAGMEEGSVDDWLNLLLVRCIEPELSKLGGVFLTRYPASQAALARVNPVDPRVAERFELYIDGVELANGYHELADASQQRKRFEEANRHRVDRGGAPIPIGEDFLAALDSGLPDCSGVALGFDRLVMKALGQAELSSVISFPFDRA